MIELRVTPMEGVTDRYAEASGDRNPIHVDEEFARSVGLPGRILHGLWTMAQAARAATSAADGPVASVDGGYALKSLNVQFRGMGSIGPEVVVSGQAGADGSVRLDVVQDGKRLIRGATAEVRAG